MDSSFTGVLARKRNKNISLLPKIGQILSRLSNLKPVRVGLLLPSHFVVIKRS